MVAMLKFVLALARQRFSPLLQDSNGPHKEPTLALFDMRVLILGVEDVHVYFVRLFVYRYLVLEQSAHIVSEEVIELALRLDCRELRL